MYVLLVFNDQDCEKINCIWMYDTLNDVMKDTQNIIKYSDVNRIRRIYKTSKSFFILLKIKKDDTKLYFS